MVRLDALCAPRGDAGNVALSDVVFLEELRVCGGNKENGTPRILEGQYQDKAVSGHQGLVFGDCFPAWAQTSSAFISAFRSYSRFADTDYFNKQHTNPIPPRFTTN